ncbi:uncharacterized protein LOC132723848 isoform X2 [Ruditapes philippinarum]|uniref:uncharacterized protein LOC132723848 isoform X2 n=1 Tax=Ruditapes philippinarum TaxID=129788 RepID=UPI00295BA1E3|nr:uncharacterized protein LOC132723848 isoform X2 [Ruditapes philippinarum]
MATKQGPGARGNHRTTSHFTLGNDEWKVMPTYTSDYSFVHTFPTIRTKKSVEQPCAEVIPPATNALEEGKWYSSTMRDFAEFGQLSRRNAYEASKSSCKRNKDLQTSELGLLQEDSRFPVTTMYRAQMPKCTTARQICKD